MGRAEIVAVLSHLADKQNVAAATQNQALNALVFLYREVLTKDPGELKGTSWVKRKRPMPVVLRSPHFWRSS